MKRIPVVVLALVLCLLMVAPAFATSGHTVSGKWVPSGATPVYTPAVEQNVDVFVNYTVKGYNRTQFQFIDAGTEVLILGGGGSALWFYDDEGMNQNFVGEVFDFGSTPQPVSDAFYAWFTQVFEPVPIPSGWPSSVPVPPADYEYTLLLEHEGYTYLYMMRYEPVARISDANDNGERTLSFALESTAATHNIQRYILLDGSWAYDSVGSLRSFTFDETLDFKYSTFDIYDVRGDRFFPLPLWAEMEQVAQGGLRAELPVMGQTVQTLVIVGMTILASLVGFVLLRKVFNRFQIHS